MPGWLDPYTFNLLADYNSGDLDPNIAEICLAGFLQSTIIITCSKYESSYNDRFDEGNMVVIGQRCDCTSVQCSDKAAFCWSSLQSCTEKAWQLDDLS